VKVARFVLRRGRGSNSASLFDFSSIFSFVGFKIIDLEESKETLIVTLDATELPRCPKCG